MTGAGQLSTLLEGELVVIRAPRCVLVLTGEEIVHLMHLDREVWIRALRRGKAYRRGEATAGRLARRLA